MTIYAGTSGGEGHTFIAVAGIVLDTVHGSATTPAGSGSRWQPASEVSYELSSGSFQVVTMPASCPSPISGRRFASRGGSIDWGKPGDDRVVLRALRPGDQHMLAVVLQGSVQGLGFSAYSLRAVWAYPVTIGFGSG